MVAITVSDRSDDGSNGPSLDDHPMLREFFYVFVGELQGFLLPHEIDFHIDFVLGEEPISQAPYQMTTPDLFERKL